MRGEQQMLLLPRMLQSIEVLQLSTLDLEGYLYEAAESNEALVLEPATEAPEGAELTRGLRSEFRGPVGSREATDAHDEMLRNQPEPEDSLPEIVEKQLATTDLDPQLCDWVRFLIGCLDDTGYLSADDERLLQLAEEEGMQGGAALLGSAIAALQHLEPRGLGARDAIEALLLQLNPEDPDYFHLCTLLEDFLEDLARNKLPSVARAMELDLEELDRLLLVLRALDPRPAARLIEQGAPVIHPDVVVEGTRGSFEVRVMRSGLPAVKVDDGLRDLAKDRTQTKEVRSYLRGKLEQARWIVDAVEQRGATLLRIASAVFDSQSGFLEHGPGNIAPLRMNKLAAELELHVSTVSRAVAAKHVQTPWGIFPLREFFQASAGGGDGTARDGVREAVRAIIAAEDSAKPLSDDGVVAVLGQRNLKVARRTVTKYRKELDIPSSYRRRKYKS